MRKRLNLIFALTFSVVAAIAQSVPSPKEHFGFNIGDDYMLATYTQTEAYFKKLAASDRVKMVDLGLTEEGRHQWQMIVTSPENHKKLDRYKEISVKMARAEGVSEDEAKALSAEGKAIVWIDGGLHATETVGTHQLIETLYDFVSRTDPETMRILDKVVILFVHANPDGQELVSNWYMRNSTPAKRSLEDLPRLYQKYIGHDNNRDFYMLNMKETQNMARQLFIEWIPQIMYNHHQSGPAGSIVAGPPYRDPFNYVFDPMMITGIDAVGAAMVNRLNAEKKPGFTRLGGSVFSTWYNGGLRTTTHFHNMIGLLTETVGSPTPAEVPLVPSRLIPNNNTPNPVTPQKWHFRQSIDYSVTMNYAVLDYAARNSDQLLMNIWRMGRNSIDRGSMDYWTPYPSRVEAINTAWKNRPKKDEKPKIESEQSGLMGGRSEIPGRYYDSIFKAPSLRDARGYVIPSDQADFATAVRYVNALLRTGIRVETAKSDFTVGKKKYPAGSYIVKTNQAFRPHIIDLFEPQDHPNDFQYPGGPPIRPYDAAGWTLAYQMGVQFDRFIEDFTGPFEQVKYGELQSPKGRVEGSATAGYLLNAKANNSFVAVNDLLKEGADVYRLPNGAGKNTAAGTYYVPASAKAKSIIEKNADAFGLVATGVSKAPSDGLAKVSTARIALWDEYGGSMPSGWVRWLMEQYHFNATVIYPKDIDAGDLNKKFDVIIFVRGAIPSIVKEPPPEWGYPREPKEENIPAEWHKTMGKITPEKSIPALKKFLEEGGKIVTIGTSTNLAYHLGLPVKNALTEIGPNGVERRLPGDKYYVPGSILRINLDSAQSATWGMSNKADVYFENSPVFKLAPEAIASGKVKPLAWFTDEAPLRSGWAWGQPYLKGGVTAFEAPVGKGTLYAFGPEITFRAQSHGTFKMLFNELISVDQPKRSIKLDAKR